MRILTAATHLEALGGLERAQLQACRELHARGHQIDLVYTQPGDLSTEWEEIVENCVRVRDYSLSRRHPIATGWAVCGAAAAVRRLRPDAAYFHNHRHAISMRLSGRPLVCHLHLPPPETRSRQECLGLSRVDTFVSVSRFLAQQWSEFLGRDIADFVVVPNGVDTQRFRPLDEEGRRSVRAALGLPVDRCLVVYAGRVVAEKGVDCALEAMRLLAPGEFHFAVAGGPSPDSVAAGTAPHDPYWSELRGRYRDAHVTWLGRLSDVSQLLSAADVVVLPSRWPDPLPLIVLETLASGTPIIASSVGGIGEMLTGPLCSFLVPKEDARALAERVRSLRDWRTETPSLGAIGRNHVEANFALSRMGDLLAGTLACVAGEPAGLGATRALSRAVG